ncbi:MAG: DUF177 domain-containing protein [Proteobacteria bacterium]|nr:DUF177 domain-containing protein [Pseudomonadota bacterium]
MPENTERLRDVAGKGEIDFTLIGSAKEGSCFLHLEVSGWLNLVCQRCLEEMRWPVKLCPGFEIVEDSRLLQPAGADEKLEQIPVDSAMDVNGLVEEEILLALPFSPMHAETDCVGHGPVGSPAEKKPFFSVITGSGLKPSKEF